MWNKMNVKHDCKSTANILIHLLFYHVSARLLHNWVICKRLDTLQNLWTIKKDKFMGINGRAQYWALFKTHLKSVALHLRKELSIYSSFDGRKMLFQFAINFPIKRTICNINNSACHKNVTDRKNKNKCLLKIDRCTFSLRVQCKSN